MFGLKIILVKKYKRLLLEVYGKAFAEGQLSILQNKVYDKGHVPILGRAAPNKVDNEINDIMEREGF